MHSTNPSHCLSVLPQEARLCQAYQRSKTGKFQETSSVGSPSEKVEVLDT